MDLILIKENSPEWEYMWEWLASHPINSDLSDPRAATNGNDYWRYKGSLGQKNRVIHQFTHPCHPATQSVKELLVSASDKMTEDDIEKRIQLK